MAPAPVIALPVNVTSSIRTFTPLEMVNAVLPECVMAAALFDITILSVVVCNADTASVVTPLRAPPMVIAAAPVIAPALKITDSI